jgi:hypothetical protein
MDKIEKKASKQLVKVLKKELGAKYKVVVKSNNDTSRDYTILVYKDRDDIYYFNKVVGNAVATVYQNNDHKNVPATIRKVLYDFFIA